MRSIAFFFLLFTACGGPPPCDWCFGNRTEYESGGSVFCQCPVPEHAGIGFVIATGYVSCDEGRAKYLEWLVNDCAAIPSP